MYVYPQDEIYSFDKDQRQEIISRALADEQFMNGLDPKARAFFQKALGTGVPVEHVHQAIYMIADHERYLIAHRGELNKWPDYRGSIIDSNNPPVNPFFQEVLQYDLAGARITMWLSVRQFKKYPAFKRAIVRFRNEQLIIREIGPAKLGRGEHPPIKVYRS